MPATKKKLTLSVDAQTIEAAKRSGINLSELTEQILRVVGENPTEGAHRQVVEDYEPLLESLRLVARRYETKIPIGHVFAFDFGFDEKGGYMDPRETAQVWLTPSGQIGRSSFEDFEWDVTGPSNWADGTLRLEKEAIDKVRFDSPMEIVNNALKAISDLGKERRARRQSVDLAIQFVEVLAKKDPPGGKGQMTRRKAGHGPSRRRAGAGQTTRSSAKTVRGQSHQVPKPRA